MWRSFALLALLGSLSACAGSQSAPGVSPRTSTGQAGVSGLPGTCCNLYWNPTRLTLQYGAKPKKAELSYWASQSYFFYPVYCRHGSQISVTTGRTWRDSSPYDHTIVKFATRSRGPDRCSMTAALYPTGSPPLATIRLNIR